MPTTTGKATDFITFSRASLATVTDNDGKIKWASHNLVLNSASPATQSITIVTGAQYTVQITGAGSVALSGAGTGTVTAASPVTLTASTTTLTLTVTAPVTLMWAYRSDLGGMQLNGSGSTYNATTGAIYHGPRLDFNPVTLAPSGILIEEQRTNLILNSGTLTNASFTKIGSSASSSALISPSGSADAFTLTEDTATGFHISDTTVTFTAASYTYYVIVKRTSRDFIFLQENSSGAARRSWFNISTGVLGTVGAGHTASITHLGNEWYRCAIIFTGTALTTVCRLGLTTGNNVVTYTGDGSSNVAVYAQQCELGLFPTSYIPTGASTVTRSADVASVATSAFPYSASEGSYVAAFQTLYSGVAPSTSYVISSDLNSNKRPIYLQPGLQNAASFDGSTIISAVGDVTGDISKTASAYNSLERAIVTNGGTVATGAVAASYSISSVMSIGGLGAAGQLNGHIRQITYIPRRLSNAELQQRTA